MWLALALGLARVGVRAMIWGVKFHSPQNGGCDVTKGKTMTDRKQALADLIAKVEAGQPYETMGHTIMCQRAFPKPEDFDGSREAYSNSAAQMAILAWRNDDLNAAKALHEAVLPNGEGWEVYRTGKYPGMIPGSSPYKYAARVGYGTTFNGNDDNPARAWLIAILKALIAMEKDND